MSDSLVSVVVPCFNQGLYLRECVDSVLASTYAHFEVIVVNDGSTDIETLRIIKGLKHEKLTVVNQANTGLPGARNAGISIAKGRYILPLDADDTIMPTFLEKAVSVLDFDDRIGIVGGVTELFGEESGIFKLPKYSKRTIMRLNCLVCTHMFRREDWEKVGGYNPNMRFGLEDWDFWLSLIEIGRKVYQFDEVLFRYRKHGVSMIGSMTDKKRKLMSLQVIDNHPKLYKWNGNYKYFLESGQHSIRRRFLDIVFEPLCFIVFSRRRRRAIKSFINNIP